MAFGKYKTVQAKLDTLAHEKRLSKADLARKIELPNDRVRKIISGNQAPGYPIFEGIAKAFPDVDMNYFFRDDWPIFFEEAQSKEPLGAYSDNQTVIMRLKEELEEARKNESYWRNLFFDATK